VSQFEILGLAIPKRVCGISSNQTRARQSSSPDEMLPSVEMIGMFSPQLGQQKRNEPDALQLSQYTSPQPLH